MFVSPAVPCDPEKLTATITEEIKRASPPLTVSIRPLQRHASMSSI